jgi:glycosyltransferase involved in cell wall biosynthesis
LPFEQRKHLLFVGNFLHRPNCDGVNYFLREVFPLIQQSLPNVEFHIAGHNVPDEIAAMASDKIHVLGYVPNIDPLFHGHRVMIAPVRFGAGTKGKIGDALAHGLPVVTTSIGAEGMGFQNGHQAMIADDPAAFAKAVTEVYDNPELWQVLADGGYNHIASHFTPEVIGKCIIDSVKRVLASSPAA